MKFPWRGTGQAACPRQLRRPRSRAPQPGSVYLVRHGEVSASGRRSSRVNDPKQPRELGESDRQKEKRKSQPHTAARPCGSSTAELLSEGFPYPSFHTAREAVQLDAAKKRESRADNGKREPVSKRNHDLMTPIDLFRARAFLRLRTVRVLVNAPSHPRRRNGSRSEGKCEIPGRLKSAAQVFHSAGMDEPA